MHIVLLLLLPYIVFGFSLRAMEGEECPYLHVLAGGLSIQGLDENDGDLESRLTDNSALSEPKSTNSISSLSSLSAEGSYIGSQTRPITEQNYNTLRTDLNLLKTQIESQQTQLMLLNNKIGRMKGEGEVIGGARICNGVTTMICILLLWGVVGAEYFGLTVNL